MHWTNNTLAYVAPSMAYTSLRRPSIFAVPRIINMFSPLTHALSVLCFVSSLPRHERVSDYALLYASASQAFNTSDYIFNQNLHCASSPNNNNGMNSIILYFDAKAAIRFIPVKRGHRGVKFLWRSENINNF
ncbi:hypothetical protein TNCV_5053541 [Trichonephila clavipes]|nr:hypothetical protein TNCV_5053541 [Trichonephila clavipes]